MSNEVINVKQLPKETVAKFVNDAAEMETSSFTLKQTAEETEKQANMLKWSAENNLKKSQESVNNAKHKLEDAEKKRDTVRKDVEAFNFTYSIWKNIPWHWVIVICLMGGIQLIAFGLSSIQYLFFDSLPESNSDFVFLFVISFIIYFITIIAIITLIKKHKAKKVYEIELKQKISTTQTAEQHVNQCQTEYDNLVLANNKQAQTSKQQEQKAKELEEHASMLRKNASEIDATLQQHYSLGVIPPDYRDMLRVLYIQRAFRNDQVDTMREATLLCDRDVYHIEIKNGLSEIANAIQSLSSTLSEINWNITRMNSELRDIANGQERLISETESARYAAESVRRAQEDILWYERENWRKTN